MLRCSFLACHILTDVKDEYQPNFVAEGILLLLASWELRLLFGNLSRIGIQIFVVGIGHPSVAEVSTDS
jgi:hypothetical protein